MASPAEMPATGAAEGLPPIATIEMASVTRLEAYLPDGDFALTRPYDMAQGFWDPDAPKIVTPNHPFMQWSIATSPEHPSVLYDDGAAFCSPILAWDEAGNAVHCHPSPLGGMGYKDPDELYFPRVRELVHAGRIGAMVTGSNLWIDEEITGKNPVDEVMDEMETRFRHAYEGDDLTFYPLVPKRHHTQGRTSPVIPDYATVCGFTFIPRYIDRQGVNRLLVVADHDARRLNNYLESRSGH